MDLWKQGFHKLMGDYFAAILILLSHDLYSCKYSCCHYVYAIDHAFTDSAGACNILSQRTNLPVISYAFSTFTPDYIIKVHSLMTCTKCN